MTEFLVECITTGSQQIAEWDDFVNRCAGGTFYHSSAWLHALAEGMAQNIRVYLLRDSKRIHAGVVLRESRKWGLAAGLKPWATAYNGLVVSEDSEWKALKTLKRHLSQRYNYLRMVHAPQCLLPREHHLWLQSEGSTAIVDLTDPSSLWAACDRRVRQRVRKAVKLGVRVSETDRYSDFYDLYCLTYRRQRLAMPLTSNQICETLDSACRTGFVKCFAAYSPEGDPAAALIVGHDAKRAYFVLAASHPSLRKSDAVTLLWWNVMLQYATSHPEVDLVGMGVDSLARFKRSFCPKIVAFYETEYGSRLVRPVFRFASYVKGLRG